MAGRRAAPNDIEVTLLKLSGVEYVEVVHARTCKTQVGQCKSAHHFHPTPNTEVDNDRREEYHRLYPDRRR